MLDNFAEQPHHAKSIREEGKLYSATGDGRLPWVSTDDIAACAVQTLTVPRPPNTDYFILGPELLTYGDVSMRGAVLAPFGSMLFRRRLTNPIRSPVFSPMSWARPSCIITLRPPN